MPRKSIPRAFKLVCKHYKGEALFLNWPDSSSLLIVSKTGASLRLGGCPWTTSGRQLSFFAGFDRGFSAKAVATRKFHASQGKHAARDLISRRCEHLPVLVWSAKKESSLSLIAVASTYPRVASVARASDACATAVA